jgi:hypothetical protein
VVRLTGSESVRILANDGSYCMGRLDRTLICVWRGVCTVTAVETIHAACEALLADPDGAATYITVLEPTSPAPAEAARVALAGWSREVVPRLARAVVVVEGGGFRAALVQGVCLALTTFVPHRVPFKFVGSVIEGADRLAPLLTEGSVPELVRAVEWVRSALPPSRKSAAAPTLSL